MTRYEMLEKIRVGKRAEIFRGRAVAGGGFEKPVAIKRILPHLCRDPHFVQMLIAEANTLSQLRHRNIGQIFDVGINEDGQHYLVMEYVPGTDVRALFEALEQRGKRLPAHLAVHVAAEVSDALDFAHCSVNSEGDPLRLVHRDVSPSNMLLSLSGEVKLTDFGIAKHMEEVTGSQSVRGKFAYISPEQAENDPVDARSDVFALGIVAFELVTGHRLFSAMSDFEALKAVRSVEIPRPSSFDRSIEGDLEQILMRAVARVPSDRFQTASEFGNALREYRYAALTTAGDPAEELARIVAAVIQHSSTQQHDEEVREPTVLRIHTVAGFGGAGSAEQRLPSEDSPMFADEETRALSTAQIREVLDSAPDSARIHAAPTQRIPTIARTGELPVPGAQSHDGPHDGSQARSDQLEEAFVGAVPMEGDRLPSLGDGPTRRFPGPAAFPTPRAATPTTHRFVAPTLERSDENDVYIDDPPDVDMQTEYISRVEQEYFGLPKRKAIALASVLAGVLGIVVFAVVGGLSSDSERAVLGNQADASPAVVDEGKVEGRSAGVGARAGEGDGARQTKKRRTKKPRTKKSRSRKKSRGSKKSRSRKKKRRVKPE